MDRPPDPRNHLHGSTTDRPDRRYGTTPESPSWPTPGPPESPSWHAPGWPIWHAPGPVGSAPWHHPGITFMARARMAGITFMARAGMATMATRPPPPDPDMARARKRGMAPPRKRRYRSGRNHLHGTRRCRPYGTRPDPRNRSIARPPIFGMADMARAGIASMARAGIKTMATGPPDRCRSTPVWHQTGLERARIDRGAGLAPSHPGRIAASTRPSRGLSGERVTRHP